MVWGGVGVARSMAISSSSDRWASRSWVSCCMARWACSSVGFPWQFSSAWARAARAAFSRSRAASTRRRFSLVFPGLQGYQMVLQGFLIALGLGQIPLQQLLLRLQALQGGPASPAPLPASAAPWAAGRICCIDICSAAPAACAPVPARHRCRRRWSPADSAAAAGSRPGSPADRRPGESRFGHRRCAPPPEAAGRSFPPSAPHRHAGRRLKGAEFSHGNPALAFALDGNLPSLPIQSDGALHGACRTRAYTAPYPAASRP